MLDKPIDEIVCENGKVVGVKSGKEASLTDTATVKHLIVTHSPCRLLAPSVL